MTTSSLRRRYLVALGLSTGVLTSCRSTEPTTVSTAPPDLATPTQTAATDPTAPLPLATVASWKPKVLPPPPPGTAIGPEPNHRMPSCPSGEFCIPESKGETPAPSPHQMCADKVPAPEDESPGGPEKWVTFNAEQTKRERTQTANACCYNWVIPCPGGRPLMVGGSARTAPEATTDAWLDEGFRDAFAALSDEARALLAEHYAAEASYEHASIASFARVSLSLLAAGAPAELLERAHRAALDEVAHARTMYTMASACRGAAVGPGGLDLTGMAAAPQSIADIAEEAFVEGCVGEVTAALVLREEAAMALGDAIRTALERMATDEEAHAELAWRTVAWALSVEPEAVRARLERAAPRVVKDAELAATSHPGAREPAPIGIAGAAERSAIKKRAIAEVTLPCLDALLAQCPVPAAAVYLPSTSCS
jgi:hypothetical protein